MDALELRLKAMQGNMAQQMEDYDPNRSGGRDSVPDDTYSAKVKPEMLLSKPPAEKLMVGWAYIITDGTYKGKRLDENTVLQGDSGVGSINQAGSHICRQHIEMLGKTWPDRNLPALRKVIAEIYKEEPEIQINVRNKPDSAEGYKRYNVYFKTDDTDAPATDAGTDAGTGTETTDVRPLIDFCTKHDITGITDEHDDATIIESFRASGLTFTAGTELDAEEEELLRSLGGEDLIVPAEPEPPTPTPVAKKKATPASVHKAAPAPARKAAPAKKKGR